MSFQEQTTQSQGTGPVKADLGTQSIFDTLVREPDFELLVEAVRAAGIEHVLRAIGPITFFAPASPIDVPPDDLREVLERHIVEGRQLVADLKTAKRLKTRAGEFVPVQWSRERVDFGDAHITRSDIVCTNGVIQVIDKALVPVNHQ